MPHARSYAAFCELYEAAGCDVRLLVGQILAPYERADNLSATATMQLRRELIAVQRNLDDEMASFALYAAEREAELQQARSEAASGNPAVVRQRVRRWRVWLTRVAVGAAIGAWVLGGLYVQRKFTFASANALGLRSVPTGPGPATWGQPWSAALRAFGALAGKPAQVASTSFTSAGTPPAVISTAHCSRGANRSCSCGWGGAGPRALG